MLFKTAVIYFMIENFIKRLLVMIKGLIIECTNKDMVEISKKLKNHDTFLFTHLRNKTLKDGWLRVYNKQTFLNNRPIDMCIATFLLDLGNLLMITKARLKILSNIPEVIICPEPRINEAELLIKELPRLISLTRTLTTIEEPFASSHLFDTLKREMTAGNILWLLGALVELPPLYKYSYFDLCIRYLSTSGLIIDDDILLTRRGINGKIYKRKN